MIVTSTSKKDSFRIFISTNQILFFHDSTGQNHVNKHQWATIYIGNLESKSCMQISTL